MISKPKNMTGESASKARNTNTTPIKQHRRSNIIL